MPKYVVLEGTRPVIDKEGVFHAVPVPTQITHGVTTTVNGKDVTVRKTFVVGDEIELSIEDAQALLDAGTIKLVGAKSAPETPKPPAPRNTQV